MTPILLHKSACIFHTKKLLELPQERIINTLTKFNIAESEAHLLNLSIKISFLHNVSDPSHLVFNKLHLTLVEHPPDEV